MTPKEDFETRLGVFGRKIDELVADAREEYREERQELKDRWNRLESRRVEVVAKGDSAWEEFKDDLEEEWNDIKRSYEDLRKRFGE